MLGLAVVLPASADGVPFLANPEEILAGPRDRPVVLIFGAPWCGWCRKMETVTLADPAIETLATDFLWLQIDIDRDQELAAQFGVRGVPAAIILNEAGGVIGEVSGYVPPDRFTTFLNETLESPAQPVFPVPATIAKFLEASGDECEDLTRQLVTSLASPRRQSRQAILQAFEQKGDVCAGGLVGLLSHPHLAIRAAAFQALQQIADVELTYNPFAAPADRDLQTQKWKEWLEKSRA